MKTKINILIVILFTGLFFTACSEEDENAATINSYLFNGNGVRFQLDEIDGIPQENYESYYFEDFESGSFGGWTSEDYNQGGFVIKFEVEDGYYKMVSTKNEIWLSHLNNNFFLESYEDFDITIKYKYIDEYITSDSQYGSKMIGVFFGSQYSNNFYQINSFGIKGFTSTVESLYTFGFTKYDNQGSSGIGASTEQEATNYINPNHTSNLKTLTIRKYGTNLISFLDGEKLNHTIGGFTWYGNQIGLMIQRDNIAIDEIEIKKIIQ